MFFFPLFPEDWSQAVSDESSVGRKSNPIAVQSSWLFLLVRIYFFLYSKVLALSLEIKQAYDCIMLFKVGKTGMVCRPQMPSYAACVASVSNRVIARKLEREQKNKKVEGGEGGEKRKRLPANPTILENAPWYLTVRFICKLTARQNRIITNRLPLDHQICKITCVYDLHSSWHSVWRFDLCLCDDSLMILCTLQSAATLFVLIFARL